MKQVILPLVAVLASLTLVSSAASAQEIRCGAGYGYSGFVDAYGFNFNRAGFERPPYFALFPPVYYSNEITKRPTGISPFAAPPGVTPVEMYYSAQPQRIVNPHFDLPAPTTEPIDPPDAENKSDGSPASSDSDT